jgi:hypothetical protein
LGAKHPSPAPEPAGVLLELPFLPLEPLFALGDRLRALAQGEPQCRELLEELGLALPVFLGFYRRFRHFLLARDPSIAW